MGEYKEGAPDASVRTVEIENDGWDLESRGEAFVTWVQQQDWYRPDLLYSGFIERPLQKRAHSTWGEGIVFCGTEKDLLSGDSSVNPMSYAEELDQGVIAVYDPGKMDGYTKPRYKIINPSALLALVKIKFTA